MPSPTFLQLPSSTPSTTPSLRRLYLSAHLRFVDRQTPPQILSSHYRALLLDAQAEQDNQLSAAHKVWHFLECILLKEPRATLPSWLSVPTGDFWTRVTGHVLRGDTNTARKLVSDRLRDAPDWPSRVASIRLRDGAIDPLAALEHVLLAPPRDDWNEWQSACAAWATCEELQPHKEVRTIMGVLAGNLDDINEAAEDWETMFVACVMYRYTGVAGAADDTSASKPLPEHGDVLVAAARGDVENAVSCIQKSLGPFHSAHLCDLLVRADAIEDDTQERREFYITEYARLLEQVRGCWRVAVDYYFDCPRTGVRHLIDLLSRVPVKGAGDSTAEKMYLICDKVDNGREKICERVGVQCRQVANFGGAMAWFARGGLDDLAIEVADDALMAAEKEGACTPGATVLAYVVTALGSYGSEQLQERLHYVRVYHEMQEALTHMDQEGCQVEHVAEFISTARSLVGGGGLPRRYWCVVAYDAARVIEKYPDAGKQFPRNAVMDLLAALELTSGKWDHHSGLLGRLKHKKVDGGVEEALCGSRKILIGTLARCFNG